jgi:hypothetical protein
MQGLRVGYRLALQTSDLQSYGLEVALSFSWARTLLRESWGVLPFVRQLRDIWHLPRNQELGKDTTLHLRSVSGSAADYIWPGIFLANLTRRWHHWDDVAESMSGGATWADGWFI